MKDNKRIILCSSHKKVEPPLWIIDNIKIIDPKNIKTISVFTEKQAIEKYGEEAQSEAVVIYIKDK